MGYSVIVQFRNPEDRNQMLKFLLKHELLWKDEFEFVHMVRGPVSDPSYCSGRGPELGFDFSLSGDPSAQIAYYLCYWAAGKCDGAKVYYDGIEEIKMPEDPLASLKQMRPIGSCIRSTQKLWTLIQDIYAKLDLAWMEVNK